jgi:hypothetical protein
LSLPLSDERSAIQKQRNDICGMNAGFPPRTDEKDKMESMSRGRRLPEEFGQNAIRILARRRNSYLWDFMS